MDGGKMYIQDKVEEYGEEVFQLLLPRAAEQGRRQDVLRRPPWREACDSRPRAATSRSASIHILSPAHSLGERGARSAPPAARGIGGPFLSETLNLISRQSFRF